MKCVITGSTGVVGSNLGEIFESRFDWEVIGVASREADARGYLRADVSRGTELSAVAKRVSGADLVVHCAAIIDGTRPASEICAVNLCGSINALQMARDLGASVFVNVSSIQVIGKIVQTPITEGHACEPMTYYHLSKLQAEAAIGQLADEGLRAATLRIPSPVGLRMPPRTIFPIFVQRALANETITLVGDKRRRQNYLDLRDLAGAVEAVFSNDGARGVYNIASATSTSNEELARAIVEETGSRSEIVDRSERTSGEIEDWDISCERARGDFGYRSAYPVRSSIRWVAGGA